MNKKNTQFLKKHQTELKDLFYEQLEELKERVCNMAGDTAEERELRDRAFLSMNEIQIIIDKIENINKTNEVDLDFV